MRQLSIVRPRNRILFNVFCLRLRHFLPILLLIHISFFWHVNSEDLFALAALYTSTNGPHWSSSCRWPSTGTPTCTSPGVTCSSGRVTQVDLTGCNIKGTLPYEWSNLSALLYILLHFNLLTGTVPHQWSNMSTLQCLSVHSNQLTGTLPHQWSSMSALQYLSVHSNQLTGTLPQVWSNMSALKFIVLSFNNLTGPLPHQWSSMAALRYMYLHFNQFTGTLPHQWSSMAALQYMNINFNQLAGTLPHQWSSMAALQYMYLHSNQLTGALPHQWSNMSALQNLSLHSNKLTGTLPHNWQTLPAATYQSSSMDLRDNCMTVPLSAWYTVALYASSVVVAPRKPAVLCIVSVSKSNSRSSISSRAAYSTTSATPSLHCDVQLCGLAVPTVNVSGALSFSPRVPLLPAVPGVAHMRAAPVPFAATRGKPVFTLRIACGDYPLPLDLRDAVLLHSGDALHLQEAGAGGIAADEILLSLPNSTLDGPSWLPAGALPFRTTNAIRIGLAMSCVGEVAVVVTVPVLPEPLSVLATTTAAVSGAAQWVSVAGGAGTAGSLGRAAAAQRLQFCSGVDASYGGLLGVSIGGIGDLEHSYARGAVVGNVGVLAGAAAALLCVALVYGAVTTSDCRSSLLRVALPSSLLPVWFATLPTTAAAMPLLVDGDIGFLLLGAAAVLLPMLLLLLAVQVAAHSGRLVVVDRELRSEQQRDCTCVAVLTLLRLSLARRWRWEDAASVSPTPSTLLRAAWVVLLDHRVLWYPALDAGVLTATCVLGVVGGMGDVHLCRRAGWAMLALCAGQLCVCVAVQPMASLASNVHCASCLLLTCAALLVQCIILSGGELLPPAAATAAVALQLAVVGLSFAKLLDDIWNVARSVVRLFAELAEGARPSSTSMSSEPNLTVEAKDAAEPRDNSPELFDWQPVEEDQSPAAMEFYASEEASLPLRRLMLYEELAQLAGDDVCGVVVH